MYDIDCAILGRYTMLQTMLMLMLYCILFRFIFKFLFVPYLCQGNKEIFIIKNVKNY